MILMAGIPILCSLVQSSRRIKKYLAQSCDCTIGAFKNCRDRERGWLKHFLSQTVRARELQFQKKVHFPPPVMCHTSYVTCQVSPCRILRNKVGWVPPVTCHVSQHTCQIKKKICQRSETSRWWVCHQRGYPV